MSDPAKKLDDDQIDRELFDNPPPEQSSIQIKIPAPPESALVRKIADHLQSWVHHTIIVDLAPEPEVENSYVIEFKTGIHDAIVTTYLAPAWDDLAQPLNAEIQSNLEHTRNCAIQYSHLLANYKYSNCIDLDSVNKILDAFKTGDWLSRQGLTAIERKLCEILRLPQTNI